MDLSDYQLEALQESSGLLLCRAQSPDCARQILVRLPDIRFAKPADPARLEREFAIRASLDSDRALIPLQMVRHGNRPALLLQDPGGQPFDRVIGKPCPIAQFLEYALGIASALEATHACGLTHMDVKPASLWIDDDGRIRLTNFGLAVRQTSERPIIHGPDVFDGSFEYMAPEQTGRTNRLPDSRSDLYSLGVTLYELLVGALPFNAVDRIDWVHCHMARQPTPPTMRRDGVPPAVEAIVLKLLAKDPDDRYQTASGVVADLHRCHDAMRTGNALDVFVAGRDDRLEQIRGPKRLYGRDTPIDILAEAFASVAANRQFRLVVVTGPSGIGKSAVVGEFCRTLHGTSALFATGKFDQFKQNIPFATLTEAFEGLLKQILIKDDVQLDHWRTELAAALGDNGQLMVDLFPTLGLVIGEQHPLAWVSPQEAKNRFNLVFQRFVRVFARPEHPLVLFLDDLQWLDSATLELLELLATNEPIPCLMVIGACRSMATQPSHPLAKMLVRTADASGTLKQIDLLPLTLPNVINFAADALQAPPAAIASLAELAFEKTQGNPYFLLQFLLSISNEGFLSHDNGQREWRFDLEQIRAAAITENVAELMVAKLGRYPAPAVSIIKLLACVGTSSPTALVAALLEQPRSAVDHALQNFVFDGLLLRIDEGYAFAHDSVREAAYVLATEEERASAHVRIGRVLAAAITGHEADDRIFAAVEQLNRGASLITTGEERARLAALNLEAGKRTIAAAAYETALKYLDSGIALLAIDGDTRSATSFELEFCRADCSFMTGEVALAEQCLARLATRTNTMTDTIRILTRQMVVYGHLGQFEIAVGLAADCAARMGQALSLTPSAEELAAEYDAFVRKLDGRAIESLVDLPAMTDPDHLRAMEVLDLLIMSSGVHREDLQVLTILRMCNISLDHGLSQETARVFSNLAGLVLGWRFGDFAMADGFGRLALRLVNERGYNRYAARLYAVISGTIGPWSMPLSDCFDLAVRAIDEGREQGAVVYAGYPWSTALAAAIADGRPLSEVYRLAEAGLAIMAKMKFSLAEEFIRVILITVRELRGLGDARSAGSATTTDAAQYEAYLAGTPHLWHALVRYRVRKLQLRYFAGEYDECLAIVAQLTPEIAPIKVFERAEFCLFSGLARAASLTDTDISEQTSRMAALIDDHRQLAQWSALCPTNFACRAALLAAEIARLEGRDLDAQNQYEGAIRAAADAGMVSIEALAYELAGRYYASRSFETIAQAYLRNARACYARWGADAKVAQLDRSYPDLGRERTARAASGLSPGDIFDNVDLSALVEIYQAVSGEILLDRLVDRLMVTAVEQAGAVRGLLLLPAPGGMLIAAEARTEAAGVAVEQRSGTNLAGELPVSILNYVARSLEPIILDDAAQHNIFSADVYLMASKQRSILCLPLVKKSQLVAVLYLENPLASHIFTPARLAVLRMLASQAAVSIENAGLFREAEEARDRARRVNDELRQSFDMIPTLAWRAFADGRFEAANQKWADYCGTEIGGTHGDSWPGTYHPDDIGRVRDRWLNLLAFGASGEIEARIRRFDGEFRRFLFRVEPMRDENGAIVKWYGTAMDIEDFRRAEHAQQALARVSRITALGELTVSIAHEVNQPLMAIVTNAATCMRWLADDRLNLTEARRAAERIISDGHRAGDVIASIRALARKAEPEMVPLDLNDAILEVVQLLRNELDRNAISVETRLSAGLGLAFADRVQMQQVILNLVMNGIEAIGATDTRVRKIVITAQAGDEGEIRVSVSDTGRGLDPMIHDRIYEAFYTTKPGGIGIGLSICRSIIEAHRGRLDASPNRPRGTTFSFSLPAFVEQRQVANG